MFKLSLHQTLEPHFQAYYKSTPKTCFFDHDLYHLFNTSSEGTKGGDPTRGEPSAPQQAKSRQETQTIIRN